MSAKKISQFVSAENEEEFNCIAHLRGWAHDSGTCPLCVAADPSIATPRPPHRCQWCEEVGGYRTDFMFFDHETSTKEEEDCENRIEPCKRHRCYHA